MGAHDPRPGRWATRPSRSGTNPTFEVRQRRVEAYVLDFDGDLYGREIGIEFVARLRGMERFDSVETLVAQMADDVSRTRAILAETAS